MGLFDRINAFMNPPPSNMDRRKAEVEGSDKDKLSYQSLTYSSNRPPLWPIQRSEDWDLRDHRRKLQWATTTHVYENDSLVGWAVRTHLNFVSAFIFQPKVNTGNTTYDSEYNQYLKFWYRDALKPENWDIQRRYSGQKMFRSWCALKELYGDTLAIKLAGGKFQLIEPWEIAKGKDSPEEVDKLGLVQDEFGATEYYCISTGQDTGSLQFQQLIPWNEAIYSGYFVRPSGTRPPSPLLPVLNWVRDHCDAFQYELIKRKLGSMFGMIIFRDHQLKGLDFNYNSSPFGPSGTSAVQQAGGIPGAGGTNAVQPYLQYNMQPGMKLELERDDKAQWIESQSPNEGWLAFNQELERMILATYNIPFSLFNSSESNYSKLRGDFNLYKLSCEEEREENKRCLAQFVDHKMAEDFAAGKLKLPRGITDPLDISYALIPRAPFILDEQKEVQSIQAKVLAGHLTNEGAMHELGIEDSFYEVTDKLASEQAYQREKGVQVAIGVQGRIASSDQPGQDAGVDDAQGDKSDGKQPSE